MVGDVVEAVRVRVARELVRDAGVGEAGAAARKVVPSSFGSWSPRELPLVELGPIVEAEEAGEREPDQREAVGRVGGVRHRRPRTGPPGGHLGGRAGLEEEAVAHVHQVLERLDVARRAEHRVEEPVGRVVVVVLHPRRHREQLAERHALDLVVVLPQLLGVTAGGTSERPAV